VVTAASVFLATFLRSSDRPAGSAPRLE
jgi:hypothetical protein